MRATRGDFQALPSAESPRRLEAGAAGNARLTGMTGVLLFALLALEGVTILRIRPLLTWHFFFGFVLIPPILLKLGSTGYRFVRYYSGNRHYRLAGPPQPLLRVIAPIVVVTTHIVFASGVELWLFGDRFGTGWLRAHQLSFVLWFFVTAVHVLGYIARAPRLALEDFRPSRRGLSGRLTRQSLVSGSVVAGLLLAAVTAQRLSPFLLSGLRK